MNFKQQLLLAKSGDKKAQEELLGRYRPLLVRESIHHGVFDEDLYQELCITLLNCVCQRKSSAKGLEKVKHHQHKMN